MVTALNSHPKIHCFGELFKQRRPKGLHPEGESAYWLQCQESLRWRLSDLISRQKLATSFLDDVLNRHDAQEAVGFKLMLNQIKYFRRLTDLINADHYHVLHVVRRNVLKTYVSRLAARQRGYYHSDKAKKIQRVAVPTKNIEKRLRQIESDEMEIKRMFKNNGPYLQVAYEDFQHFDDATNSSVLKFLGASQFKIGSLLKKQSSDNLTEMIDNYEEVAACIADTAYAKFLDSR
jgi:LPS sulfotransferase NodH